MTRSTYSVNGDTSAFADGCAYGFVGGGCAYGFVGYQVCLMILAINRSMARLMAALMAVSVVMMHR